MEGGGGGRGGCAEGSHNWPDGLVLLLGEACVFGGGGAEGVEVTDEMEAPTVSS